MEIYIKLLTLVYKNVKIILVAFLMKNGSKKYFKNFLKKVLKKYWQHIINCAKINNVDDLIKRRKQSTLKSKQ